MTSRLFPNLFSPLTIRGKTIKNRILSTGHDTTMPTDGLVNDRLVAYHAARARGGAGLIVTQVAGVHETARYTSHMLMATSDDCIAGYRRLAEACHAHGAIVLSQIFHPGREIMESADGLLAVTYAPSATPNERFHVMPRAMSKDLIGEIRKGYGQAARRIYSAGLDGVELVASHGYLPAQFLNPRVNVRTDPYGGSAENRLRFLKEVLGEIRRMTADDFIIGIRISAGERDETGLSAEEALAAVRALEPDLDYASIIAGTSASLGGAVHIVPPMAIAPAYLAPEGAAFKKALSIPVFVAGRINQPQEAEAMLARREADMCGMTRAMIADPDMPNKAADDRPDDIRACIACNQACIGHFHKGLPISCIQFPESGRELEFGAIALAPGRRKVLVAGGGPAGMKAALTAARRGHDVTLCEASGQLGGQALLAQLLPRRAEFGGLVTNLTRELAQSGATIRRNTPVTPELVKALAPDAVIIATGAKPFWPDFVRDGDMQVADAWQVLKKAVKVGSRVLVADWRCDWVGPGIAEMLMRQGSSVHLAVNGLMPGETLPLYVRDNIAGELHKLGVPVVNYARLHGVDGDSVYFQHTISQQPIIFEGIDTLVLAQGHVGIDGLAGELDGFVADVLVIGDAAAPRTAEEAIYEGLKAGVAV